MAYRSRTTRQAKWMNLRFAGTCRNCGKAVAAGVRAYYDPATRSVTCEAADCASNLPVQIVTTRFSSGATVYRNSRGRCEDAPCCGCCS